MSPPVESRTFWELLVQLIPIVCTSILALFSYLLYQLNIKNFRLLYDKPTIKVIAISTKPENKGTLPKPNILCSLKIQIKNPSSYENILSLDLKKSLRSESIDRIKSFPIPPYSIIKRDMLPKFAKVKKFVNKKLVIIGYDLRGKKIKKKFRFKDLNKEVFL